jgi:hypothetical protein
VASITHRQASTADHMISVVNRRTDVATRIDDLDWHALAQSLNDYGNATLAGLLTPAECDALAGLYPNEAGFRSRVVMARHGFGRGEYKYFSYPLPDTIETLRTTLYRHLAPVANAWNQAMNIDVRYPAGHVTFIERCHSAGQTRPTPLLLQYDTGDFNCLHQDLYGEHVFPIQVAFLLSQPGRDFSGGDFVLDRAAAANAIARRGRSAPPGRCRRVCGSSSTSSRITRCLPREHAAWCEPPAVG